MTLYAILSDIHGNLEALDAVLEDVEKHHPEKIVVLGDMIGYGPNPQECLEKCCDIADILLIGNHEADIIEPDPAMAVDKDLIRWTEEQISGCEPWEEIRIKAEKSGCASLAKHILPGIEFAHASAAKPIEQYIWPGHECQYIIYHDQIDERMAEFLEEYQELHGFCGHTHVPAVLTAYKNREIFDPYRWKFDWDRESTFVGHQTVFLVPKETTTLGSLIGKKVVINPGSVGQPRDGLPQASYVLYNGDTVTFRRIEYNLAATQEKILKIPISQEVCEYLANRIKVGK